LFNASYQTVNPRDFRFNPRADEFPEGGIIQISRLGTSYIRDRRDDPINPTKGSFQTTTFQVAARAFGGEVDFTSLYNESVFYRPLGKAVLANAWRLGWLEPFGPTVRPPITERYFAGGSTTLRGFDLDQAGPIDGGNVMAIMNLEYRFPIPVFRIKDLGAAFFYDGGNAFRALSDVTWDEVTHTGGAGLRYNTPLGPIRFDMGINLRPKLRLDGMREERVQFFFTLGHTF
jgi:outer membrane protein assembly factor BamA